MSIEKLDSAKIKQFNIPFTMIITKVAQSIRNADALAVWIYLCTLPPDWVIHKEQIKKHFSFGDKKIKDIFSYLNRSNLISYTRERNKNGTLTSVTINLLCGDKFNKDEPFESTGSNTVPVESTGSNNYPVARHPSGREALHKIYNKKEIKRKKINNEKHNFLPTYNQNQKQHSYYKPVQYENRSTVKEWGPGHPSYDSLHAKKIKQQAASS